MAVKGRYCNELYFYSTKAPYSNKPLNVLKEGENFGALLYVKEKNILIAEVTGRERHITINNMDNYQKITEITCPEGIKTQFYQISNEKVIFLCNTEIKILILTNNIIETLAEGIKYFVIYVY